MTVREYIGARYVPLFMGDWDNTVTYEPLSIVQDSGNSYTSRQYVPAGIDISNTAYWACTGNYNAQIDAYRAEVLAYDGRIDALEDGMPVADFDSVNTVKAAIDGVANNVTQLQGDVSDIETVLNSNTNIYSYFKGHNAVFIGDSYSYGTGCSDHGSGDTKRFTSVLCSMLEMHEFNYAVGSTGFCDPGSGGQNAPFSTQVLTAASNMTADEITDTRLVVIAGGFNDWNEGGSYTWNTMRSGAKSAAYNAYQNFPNALILIVPMMFKGAGANPRLFNFENAIIEGVSGQVSYGVKRTKYIQGAWTWNFGVESRFANDNLHPNDAGHAEIAHKIYANILGGVAYQNELCIISYETGFSSSVANGGYLLFEDGKAISMAMLISCTDGLTADTNTLIGHLSSGTCYPLVNVHTTISKGNEIAGIFTITTNGNVYVKANKNITTDFFVAPISYIPSGQLV